MIIEPGRICVITAGSDAGKEVIVNEMTDDNFVIVSGEKVKQRRINLRHLEPTSKKGAIIVPIAKEKKTQKKKTEETK